MTADWEELKRTLQVSSFKLHKAYAILSTAGFVQVMENLESHGIYEFHFQAWKVMEFNCWSLKVMENSSFA